MDFLLDFEDSLSFVDAPQSPGATSAAFGVSPAA
jgi:hypothetical protein